MFSSRATAWLDADSEHGALIYSWCFTLAESDLNPGRILPGFRPLVRLVQVRTADEIVEVTYLRLPDRLKILLIESWRG